MPTIHDTAQERRAKIGPARWEKIPSFTIVRNPFDRVASQYRYRLGRNQRGLKDSEMSLNDWVKRAYGEQDPAHTGKAILFQPARDWITDADGSVMVDLVVKLEDIDTGWPEIARLIGVNVSLPHANRTRPEKGGAVEELDAESAEIIRTRFDADFDMFGYDRVPA